MHRREELQHASMSMISRDVEQHPWRIELLGSLRVRHIETPIHFKRRVASLLLSFLAMSPDQTFTREALMERLWPELSVEDAANYLRVSLSVARTTLSAVSDTPLLKSDRKTVRLDSARMACDVLEFDRARERALAAPEGEGIELLRTAAHFYQGTLLPEFEASWLVPIRQRLEDDYLNVLRLLIRQLSRAGRPDEAIEFARRLLEIDPLQESSHRTLIRLYGLIDRPAAARRQYHELVDLLQRELGVEPEEETQRLAAPYLLAPDAPPAAPLNIPPPLFARPDPLPSTSTQFIGREDEAQNLAELLLGDTTRLVTITGHPGVGKTRLAIEVGRRIRDAYSGGVRFVPLAEVREPEAFAETLASIVNAPPASAGGTTLERVAAQLRFGRQLLILDNLEHLLPQIAPSVAYLHDVASDLTILATSRRRIGAVGEQSYPLFPLGSPVESDEPVEVQRAASVRLFLNRARLVRPDFKVDSRNARIIAQICQQLDGLPLAIELAASWANTFTPSQMLMRLQSRRFDLLNDPSVGSVPGVAPRALWDAIESSFLLLGPQEIDILIVIGSLQGPISIDIISRLFDLEYERYVMNVISSSLITCFEVNNVMCVDILESVRDYIKKCYGMCDARILSRVIFEIMALISIRFDGEYDDIVMMCGNMEMIDDCDHAVFSDLSFFDRELLMGVEFLFINSGNSRVAKLVARSIVKLSILKKMELNDLLKLYRICLLLSDFELLSEVGDIIEGNPQSGDSYYWRCLYIAKNVVVGNCDIEKSYEDLRKYIPLIEDVNGMLFIVVNMSSILTFSYGMREESRVLLGLCDESSGEFGVGSEFVRAINVEDVDVDLSIELIQKCREKAARLNGRRYLYYLDSHYARLLIAGDPDYARNISISCLEYSLSSGDREVMLQSVLNLIELCVLKGDNFNASVLIWCVESILNDVPMYCRLWFRDKIAVIRNMIDGMVYDGGRDDVMNCLIRYLSFK